MLDHATMRALLKATDDFVARFGTVVDGAPTSHSQTGEKYTAYINGTVHAVDAVEPEVFPTADAAIASTFERLTQHHPADTAMTLYWRVLPDVEHFPKLHGWQTYCRFLISDKPAQESHG